RYPHRQIAAQMPLFCRAKSAAGTHHSAVDTTAPIDSALPAPISAAADSGWRSCASYPVPCCYHRCADNTAPPDTTLRVAAPAQLRCRPTLSILLRLCPTALTVHSCRVTALWLPHRAPFAGNAE